MSSLPWFILGRLKNRQLLLVVALAEAGNIHRAAQVLHMTQPAASKLLKDLEETLGVALFERLPRGMRPTWYGESMVRHARTVLAHLDKAHEEIMALKAGLFGRVGVGAITAPGLRLLPPAIAQVKASHPSLRIVLEIDTSPALMERLFKGSLDLLVARPSAEHDKSLFTYESLSTEPVSVFVRKDHPLLRQPALTLAELAKQAWLVPPVGSVLRHRFDLMFPQAGLAPPVDLVETSALLFVTRMVQHSDMLALLSRDVADYCVAHGMGAMLTVNLPCQMDAFGLILRRDDTPSPGTQAMLRALKQACQSVYGHALEATGAD